MHFIFELLLQPIFELVFHGVGYVTAYILVPLFTFGQVTVEPSRNAGILNPKRGRIQRAANGKYVMAAELGSGIGVLFWIVVIVSYFWIRGG